MRHLGRMDARAIVGRNLFRIRSAKAVSQEFVEATSGVSQQLLSGLEAGRKNPSIVTILRIAKAIEVSVIELLMEVDDLPMPQLPLTAKAADPKRSKRKTGVKSVGRKKASRGPLTE